MIPTCQAYGINPLRLLAAADIPSASLHDPELMIGHEQLAQLLLLGARESRDVLFGLKAGLNTDLGMTGVIGALLPNQGLWFNIYPLLRYLLLSLSSAAIHDLEVRQSHAYHTIRYHQGEGDAWVQMALFGLMTTHNVFSDVLGKNWQPSRLCMTGDLSPQQRAQIKDLIGIEVWCKAPFHALEFNAATLYQEPVIASEQSRRQKTLMGEALRRVDDRPALIKEFIRCQGVLGEFGKEAVAGALGVHPKVMQKVLADAGVTYRELVEDVRLEMARNLLRSSGYSVQDIALQLGYASASPFVQAFKRWTGNTPLQWRKRHATTKAR